MTRDGLLPPVVMALLTFHSVGCGTDQPDSGGGPAEPFVPHLTGTAAVPYSSAETMALVDPETACTVDTYEVKIVCVERSGRMVGRFGREGDGPGELRLPGNLVRGAAGTLGFTDRNTFHVVTAAGVPVMETVLPGSVVVFRPISPFSTTVVGTNPVASVVALAAMEVDLETGEIVDQWRPGSVPMMEECGVPTFGFPVIAERTDNSWVFLGCEGQLAFTQGPGPATVIRAPTYVDELPSERDVTSHREDLEEFLRMAEELTGRPSNAVNVEDRTEEYAGRPKRYHLQGGRETYDSRRRLWIPTARGRDEESFLDVYSEAAYYGTVVVRDRMIDFDIIDGTLAVLVERGVGPEDPDGVPDRAIDWYDVSGFGDGGG